MNYSIDEDFFSIKEIWDNLTKAQFTAMLITVNQISHWTINAGFCDFSVNAVCKKYHMNKREVNGSLQRLIELDLIKCIRQYQREGNQPARYITTKRFGQVSKKVRPAGSKGWASRARVNNDNNHYSGIDLESTPHNAKNENLEDLALLEKFNS
jgi:hypothetical protein